MVPFLVHTHLLSEAESEIPLYRLLLHKYNIDLSISEIDLSPLEGLFSFFKRLCGRIQNPFERKEATMGWITEPQSWIPWRRSRDSRSSSHRQHHFYLHPERQASKTPQKKARIVGLALAMITRILLLFSLTWLMRLTTPLLTVFGMASREGI